MGEDLLHAQWRTLRAWLDETHVLKYADRPVGIGMWTVADVVAHLGLGIGMLSEIRPAELDAEPMTFGKYVGHYRPAAEGIDVETQVLSVELEPDLLEGLDGIAQDAFAAVAGVSWPVVVGRRGAITWPDYVQTRLLELVVHGDELARAIPEADGSPLLEKAVESVASALGYAYEEITGHEPAEPDDMAWIRAATGRVPSDDPHLPLL